MAKRRKETGTLVPSVANYDGLLADISQLLETSRRAAARTLNSLLTETYWEIGRRIVEFEQSGSSRAEYGEALINRLAMDLSGRHGRGFSAQGLYKMRGFYLGWQILPTPSGEFQARAIFSTPSGERTRRKRRMPVLPCEVDLISPTFPLSWSHYVRLISVEKPHARAFYEAEAIRGAWSVRQLDRQISTQFFERTAHAKEQASTPKRDKRIQEDTTLPNAEIRDPYLLEFLNLKDEYSETQLEEALIQHLETFLLELGAGFTFVARQKRIRIGDEWYRIDLLLFHRRLRCLVIIDLKIGKFTHADAGQMNLYLNYAREHLVEPTENEPVGLILCTAKHDAVVHYAMGGINARVFASKYLTQLPDEGTLRREIETTKRGLIGRRGSASEDEN